MSYYGMKNGSIVKTENGYTVRCDYYDSSIRDYKGNRVWEHTEHFTKPFPTREELEEHLFYNFYMGNYHGAFGKFRNINNINFTEKEKAMLKELDKNSLNPYNSELREQYRQVELELARKHFNRLLQTKKCRYKVQVTSCRYGMTAYIRSCGTRTMFFTASPEHAKVFVGTEETILPKFKGFNVKDIKLIKVDK